MSKRDAQTDATPSLTQLPERSISATQSRGQGSDVFGTGAPHGVQSASCGSQSDEDVDYGVVYHGEGSS